MDVVVRQWLKVMPVVVGLAIGVAGYYEWYWNELLSHSPGVNRLSYTLSPDHVGGGA